MAPRGVLSCSSPSLLSVASSTAKSAKKNVASVKKVATAVVRLFKKSCKSKASDALSISDTNEDLNSEHPPSLIDVDTSQDQPTDKQEEGETDEQELTSQQVKWYLLMNLAIML
ncbi:uncharacterized protein LACBIDRAFT_324781 [Laccaria bicolor S238N-H82]|uniref:Predicted protein n=1 Tax=Laccaria bicolor (strain S238N-H82 / ATCC MYA-4686) TaxID=486041 RepID=B0D310_LACBS|nr:uncharacterized protein LACBIDRAFT_324781 [Laccaria bicolor S238N-H82]EDR11192.1 predicted protein [Laccaria bicolor S238N-H82]|eukprot:XP_001878493.1 predicted protein [Laccaria bicolor S238N-H82]